MLRISRKDYGDITVLELEGSMSMGNVISGPSSFRGTMDALIQAKRTKIVLMYQGVPYQDSSGNGEIVSAFTKVRNAGGTLVFVGLTQKISDLFEITKLAKVFQVFDTLEDALSCFGSKKDSVDEPK